MELNKLPLPGLILIKPQAFGDARGFFMESWSKERYTQVIGPKREFVQDNVSLSSQGVLRGLHFQYPFSQGKLVSVLEGSVLDVVADVRRGSPTFGKAIGVELSAENHLQLWVPEGFAHGFCVTSPRALFAYKCTEYYHPETERSLLWNDPSLGINWPVKEPSLSKKDLAGKILSAFNQDELPVYVPE
jgi:dTDP-4-dehydrorhamnose 3,5-epimerase